MHSFGKFAIVAWYDSIANIPAGWQLCDGTNGTPDLRDRFIVGAGDTYDPDDTGGGVQHVHDFSDGNHTHTLAVGTGLEPGGDADGTGTTTQLIGTTDNESSLPPFRSLVYIMEL